MSGLTYEQLRAKGAHVTQQGLTADQIRAQQPQQQPQKSGDILSRATNLVTSIFPGGKVGESIGTLAGLGVTAAKEGLGFTPKGSTAQFDTSAPSPMQVAGDVAQGGLTVAGFKGAGLGSNVLTTGLRSGALGAGFGVARELQEEDPDVVAGAVSGGATGAVTGAALQGAGQLISNTLRKLPNRFVQSALGQSKRELLAKKDLTKFVTENKKIGTTQGLLDGSKKAMNTWNTKIQTALRGSNKVVNQSDVYRDLTASKLATNAQISPQEMVKTVTSVAPESKRLVTKLLTDGKLSVQDGNKLRVIIDKKLNSRVFDAPDVSFQKDVAKTFTNTLRSTVQKLVPETKPMFSDYSQEIRLSEALANKLVQGGKKQIISFGDLFGAGIGGSVGGPGGAVAGVAARRAVQSTPFLTGGAVTADVLSRNLMPVLQKLQPSVQTEIIKAIESAISPTNQ